MGTANEQGTTVARGRPRWIAPTLMPPQPTEIGKIKIGGKGAERTSDSGAKWRLPEKYDHFVITTRTRGRDDNFVRDEHVHRPVDQGGLGDKPTELPVRLMYDAPEDNLQASMVQYEGRTKVFECDGVEGCNLQTGELVPCLRAAGGQCKCKPYARLAVILEAGRYYGGFHVFRTTSWETTRNLQTSLYMFSQQFGILAGLRLALVLYPATVEYKDGKGNLRTGMAYKVALVMRGGFDEAAQLAAEAADYRLANVEQRKQLAAATVEQLDDIDEAEQGDIADEFFPEHEPDDEPEASEGPSKTERQRDELRAKREAEAQVPEGCEIAEDESMDAPAGYRVLRKHGGWRRAQHLHDGVWVNITDTWSRSAAMVDGAIAQHRAEADDEPTEPEVPEVVPAESSNEPDDDEARKAAQLRMVEASGRDENRAMDVAYNLFRDRADVPRRPSGMVALGSLSTEQYNELADELEGGSK